MTREEDPGEKGLLSPVEIADVVFMPGGGGPDETARTPARGLLFRSVLCASGFLCALRVRAATVHGRCLRMAR